MTFFVFFTFVNQLTYYCCSISAVGVGCIILFDQTVNVFYSVLINSDNCEVLRLRRVLMTTCVCLSQGLVRHDEPCGPGNLLSRGCGAPVCPHRGLMGACSGHRFYTASRMDLMFLHNTFFFLSHRFTFNEDGERRVLIYVRPGHRHQFRVRKPHC